MSEAGLSLGGARLPVGVERTSSSHQECPYHEGNFLGGRALWWEGWLSRGRGWGCLWEEQPFWDTAGNFRRMGALPRGAGQGHSLATMPGTDAPHGPKSGRNRLGCRYGRGSPGPHPGQRRHGRRPAWQAAGRWHPPRVGSDGIAGERPVSRCCGSTPQKGLVGGEVYMREEKEQGRDGGGWEGQGD